LVLALTDSEDKLYQFAPLRGLFPEAVSNFYGYHFCNFPCRPDGYPQGSPDAQLAQLQAKIGLMRRGIECNFKEKDRG
jgi:hypothetical protein